MDSGIVQRIKFRIVQHVVIGILARLHPEKPHAVGGHHGGQVPLREKILPKLQPVWSLFQLLNQPVHLPRAQPRAILKYGLHPLYL